MRLDNVEELAERTRPLVEELAEYPLSELKELIEKKRSQRQLLELDARIAAAASQIRGLQLSLVAMLEKRRTLRKCDWTGSPPALGDERQ